MKNTKISIIGLGYVGLPLAVEFAKKFPVVGFDINELRVKRLNEGVDDTLEVEDENLQSVLQGKSSKANGKSENGLLLTSKLEDIAGCNIHIVTVPTPIDDFNAPDLKPLLGASASVGKILKKGDIVIYESTVYPGCTEEDCVPVLERESGLKFNEDFYCGYSPERINPGDKVNTLTTIKKVTSGSTPEIGVEVDNLYKTIIKAGTHLAPNMKVAEASKAIENAQRDVNISFVNELSLIFERMGIDTTDVLEAAGTKWNFLKFKPGLVGGHCIGVDPYYLAHKAQSLGYHPNVILSGRRVNDSMGMHVANKVVKLLIGKGTAIKDAKALILGVTFKENCPDIRNTRVVDIHHELIQFGMKVDIYDPWANPQEVKEEYDLDILTELNGDKYDAIIVAVSHNEFLELDFKSWKENGAVVFDTKAFIGRELVDGRL
jgi:UDP-N-acetyl-D-galactosamine dehydrogenase